VLAAASARALVLAADDPGGPFGDVDLQARDDEVRTYLQVTTGDDG